MRFTRRDFLKFTALGGAAMFVSAEVLPPTRALRLLVLSRSLVPTTLVAFTRATGIQFQLNSVSETSSKVFKTLEVFEPDLAIVPAHILTQLIRADLVRELPPTTNDQRPTPNPQRPYDPFNDFSRLASRGVIGINAYNFTPPQTWKEFFELAQRVPAYLPPVASFNAALKSLGDSINTRNTFLREQAQSLITHLQSSPLSHAQLAIAPPLAGWNFVAPHEGVEMWEDSFCIPHTSTQPELAQRFIEFAVQRQQIKQIAGKVEILSAFA